MLRIFTTRLALSRAIRTQGSGQLPFRLGYFRSATICSFTAQESLITAYDHKLKLDGKRQEFSVHFDDRGTVYKFSVSAPAYLSFYGVWGDVGCWLKNHSEREWSDSHVEIVSKIVHQVCKIKHIQSFKNDGMEVIPVKSEEEADFLSERYGMRNVVFDIGGSLTKLQGSLEVGIGSKGRYRGVGHPFEKESELRWGIRIHLCKLGLRE